MAKLADTAAEVTHRTPVSGCGNAGRRVGIVSALSAVLGAWIPSTAQPGPGLAQPVVGPQATAVASGSLPNGKSENCDLQRQDAPFICADTLRDGTTGPEMIVLPAGTFIMGSPPTEEGRTDFEGPQHEVTVAAFAIGRYEVTFEEYDRFTHATNRRDPYPEYREHRGLPFMRGRYPVMKVSWDDAVAYAEWLSAQTGEAYRLPTEAEWEYAARAGTTTPFNTGNCISAAQAAFSVSEPYGDCPAGETQWETFEVGSFAANGFGLHDVHGSEGEWVQDCWHDTYDNAPVDGRAWGEEANGDCEFRVRRGGSFNFHAAWVRSALREGDRSGSRSSYVGFRLARTLK